LAIIGSTGSRSRAREFDRADASTAAGFVSAGFEAFDGSDATVLAGAGDGVAEFFEAEVAEASVFSFAAPADRISPTSFRSD
jgi:hypothetical protein